VYQTKAQILAMAGELDQARIMLDEQGSKRHGIGTLYLILPLELTRIVLADAGDEPEHVLELAEVLTRDLDTHHLQVLRPQLEYYRARALLLLDRPDEALDSISHGIDLATTCGARWSAWQLHGLRSSLLNKMGKDQLAAQDLHSALDFCRYIANHTGDEELGTSFLARPDVSALLQRVG
jgi:hypothetical protein